MRNAFPLALLLLASASLSACVVVQGGGDDSDSSSEKHDARLRRQLAALPLGTSLDAVQGQLGSPDFIDAFRSGDQEFRIWRYRTQRMHADGDTTRDETTPLVFAGSRLIGIGDAAVARLDTPVDPSQAAPGELQP
jgi:predicted small secreted protein